jgi:hypothetical protein
MHDGEIVYDEKTPLGRVANRARKVMYTLPRNTADDDAAGVSALMHAVPDKDASRKLPKRRIKKVKSSGRKSAAKRKTRA